MKTKTKHTISEAAKQQAKKKIYNLMVGYDPILETEVKNKIDEIGIKTKIMTDCYFYSKFLTKEDIEKARTALKDTKFEFKDPKTGNLKVYKLRYLSATLAPELAKGKTVRINKKKASGKIHNAGINQPNYLKKLNKRVKKATLALVKAETKKATKSPKKTQIKANTKPVQQKLNFKAAA